MLSFLPTLKSEPHQSCAEKPEGLHTIFKHNLPYACCLVIAIDSQSLAHNAYSRGRKREKKNCKHIFHAVKSYGGSIAQPKI